MDIVNLLVTGGIALVGGGGGATLLWKWWERTDKREESEIGRLRDDVKDARAEVALVRSELKDCNDKHEEMEARMLLMEHHNASHFPRWIKDASKRVIYVNDRALISIFAPVGLGREDVMGKTFAEVLDPIGATEIERLDQAALAHPDRAASNIVQLHPSLPLMTVVKVVAVGREGRVIFEGIAFHTNEKMLADGAGALRQAEAIEQAAKRVIDHEGTEE